MWVLAEPLRSRLTRSRSIEYYPGQTRDNNIIYDLGLPIIRVYVNNIGSLDWVGASKIKSTVAFNPNPASPIWKFELALRINSQ
jgi:hypothetical protein